MKNKFFLLLILGSLALLETRSLAGLEVPEAPKLLTEPIAFELPEWARNKRVTVTLQTIDPSGHKYQVTDETGQGQWGVEHYRRLGGLQIVPSAASYAGPMQVLVDGQVVDRFNQVSESSRKLVLEKVLSAAVPDGPVLRVHYTDFSLEKTKNPAYPHRVLSLALKSYEILKTELGLDRPGAPRIPSLDFYLGDTGEAGLFPFGGFGAAEYKRAPLFLIRRDKDKVEPVILLPVDYLGFLGFWNQINQVPGNPAYSEDSYLSSSIIHEMTHAAMHFFNQNLGSTEHEVRDGDWFTEGVARYFETKIGSDAGFASMGFRRKMETEVQLSRGGANYFLRYPDESFFGLRYENALFWMYFETRYGREKLIELSRELSRIPFKAAWSEYAAVLESVTRKSIEDELADYHEWIYREEYRLIAGGDHLDRAARTEWVWSKDRFYLHAADGRLLKETGSIKTDWAGRWAGEAASDLAGYVAGDWTAVADIQPLAFDLHEIAVSGDPKSEPVLLIRNLGLSEKLRTKVYLTTRSGTREIELKLGRRENAVLPAGRGVVKISILLSNLDRFHAALYSVEMTDAHPDR